MPARRFRKYGANTSKAKTQSRSPLEFISSSTAATPKNGSMKRKASETVDEATNGRPVKQQKTTRKAPTAGTGISTGSDSLSMSGATVIPIPVDTGPSSLPSSTAPSNGTITTSSTPTVTSNGVARDLSSRVMGETTPVAAVSPPPSTFADGLPLPKFIVFDLDYTLWPFDIDNPATGPYHPVPGGQKVLDRDGREKGFFKDVPSILSHIADRSIAMGIASRDTREDLAIEMLSLLTIPGGEGRSALSVFPHIECYWDSKVAHFKSLQKKIKLPYEEMLFFDDKMYNRDVESLGVVMQLVKSGRSGGVNMAELDAGVELWRRRNNRTERET